MKKSAILTAIALTLITSLPALAQQPYVLTFSDTSSDPGSVLVAPGSSFNVTLTLTATASSIAVDYFLQILNGGSSQFRITGRDLSGSTFNQPITSNSIALQPSRALLNPQNDDDLGGSISNPNSPNGPGAFLLANFTLQVLPGAANGSYTLSTANASVGDAMFNDNSVSNATYTVNVIPEPATVFLLGAGAFLLLCPRRLWRWRVRACRPIVT